MNEEKQIDEITKILDSNCEGIPDTVCQENSCSSCKARQIIGMGYLKQSENVVELPCKIGDTVYVVDSWRVTDEPIPYQITNLTITQNKKGVWTKKYRAMWIKNGKTVDCQHNFEFAEIGKTVFLTKEEAEAKMKGGAE